MRNPCVDCGACCAYFRVQFSKRELQPAPVGHSVPTDQVESLDVDHACMKGTAHKHKPKCVNLSGRIGRDAHCSMYETRPAPCREFKASYSDGHHHPRCDEARRAHGLTPLRREDWITLEELR